WEAILTVMGRRTPATGTASGVRGVPAPGTGPHTLGSAGKPSRRDLGSRTSGNAPAGEVPGCVPRWQVVVRIPPTSCLGSCAAIGCKPPLRSSHGWAGDGVGRRLLLPPLKKVANVVPLIALWGLGNSLHKKKTPIAD